MSRQRGHQQQQSAIHFICLTTNDFEQALKQYVEEYKPDPLSKKQIENWSVQWTNQKDITTSTNANLDLDLDFEPTHAIQGELELGGEYLVVTLKISCAWSSSSADKNDKNNNKEENFQYTCWASARFRSSSSSSSPSNHPNAKTIVKEKQNNNDHDADDDDDDDNDIDDNNNNTKNKDPVQEKIRTKVMARLRQDSYISKLLVLAAKKENDNVLATAKIRIQPPHDLEERVDVSEMMCEAIQRSIWSSAESPLDVIELLLQLPSLPAPPISIISSPTTTTNTNSSTTPLAHRAKLRMLEDAMVDACERQGEEQILDDLSIDEREQQGNKHVHVDDDHDNHTPSPSKSKKTHQNHNHNHNQRSKQQRPNPSQKRTKTQRDNASNTTTM